MEVLSPQKIWVRKSHISKLQKILGPQITNCHACRTSANVTNFVSLQIHGFAICGTYLWTTHLCKFSTGINNTSGTGGKIYRVVETGGIP